MRKRLVAVAGVLLAVTATGAPAASAATEFGDTCTAGGGAPGDYTLTTLSVPAGGPIPLAAPSAGVITKMKASFPPITFSLPVSAKVLRPAGGNLYNVVAQQAISLVGGPTVADARLPVQAGDRLGVHGLPFVEEGTPSPGITPYCSSTGDGSRLGAATGDVQPGSTADFPDPAEGRVPLSAVIEPDVDNDGFGDETQDLCPQIASTQGTCPIVVLDAFAIAGKGSATVLVSSSTEAPITVAGTVVLPKGKASSSAKAKLRKVTRKVKPGLIGKFKLRFPGTLKSALGALPQGKSLTLKVTASATNAAGVVSKDKTKLKLKGTG